MLLYHSIVVRMCDILHHMMSCHIIVEDMNSCRICDINSSDSDMNSSDSSDM